MQWCNLYAAPLKNVVNKFRIQQAANDLKKYQRFVTNCNKDELIKTILLKPINNLHIGISLKINIIG
jgi:hypothetical protein